MKIWTQEEEAQRLEKRFEGINKAAFAREHGIRGGASMLSQHIKGHRPLSLEAATAYARGFKVPLAEISPRLALSVSNALQAAPSANDDTVQPPIPADALLVDPSKFRRIYVVGKGAGGVPERIWTDGDFPVGASDEYGDNVSSPDPQAFLTKVDGNSMFPKFEHGNYALVEPNSEPELEDVVLVRLKNGMSMIKRLLSRRDGFKFGSYNDPEILFYQPSEVSWIYYVAHEVPRKRIKRRF